MIKVLKFCEVFLRTLLDSADTARSGVQVL